MKSLEFVDPVDGIGEMMSLLAFVTHVCSGMFTDYDGFCTLSNGVRQTRDNFGPNEVLELPEGVLAEAGVTHINWYNR